MIVLYQYIVFIKYKYFLRIDDIYSKFKIWLYKVKSIYFWPKIKLSCLFLIKFKVITLNRVNYFFTIKVRVFVSQVIFMQLIWTTKSRVFWVCKDFSFWYSKQFKKYRTQASNSGEITLNFICFVTVKSNQIRTNNGRDLSLLFWKTVFDSLEITPD